MAKNATVISNGLSKLHWEGDLLEFEVDNGSRQVACSISREALEDAGAGCRATRWVLLETFNRKHARIARLALDKHAKAKPGSRAAIHISTSELNHAPAHA